MIAETTRAGAIGQAELAPTPPSKAARVVLVPLDGTAHALAVLPAARAVADLVQATVHIVHVRDHALPMPELLSHLGLTSEDVHGAVVSQAVGEPAANIVQFAEQRQSACIVLCPYTTQKPPGDELGHVALHVVRWAPCPVVLVPPERDRRPVSWRHILVPYDGTPTTARALTPALEIAERANAKVSVLHVAAAKTLPAVEVGTLTAPRYVDQPQYEWPVWRDEFLQRICQSDPRCAERMRVVMAVGEPVPEIVRFVQEHSVDLIVLVWHTMLAPERIAIGKAVIRDSPCPLLLIRISEGEDSLPAR